MEKVLSTISKLVISPVYAQAPPKLDEASGLLDGIFDRILPIAGFMALAMVVWGGYMWMMSAGDPGKVKQAQGTITWSIIGLVFVVLVGMILTVVFDFIGGA